MGTCKSNGCYSNATYPSILNYNANYSPTIEARSCQTNYSSSKKNTVLTIQSTCSGHSTGCTSYSFSIIAGEDLTADKINQFIADVDAELARRGLSSSGISTVSRNTIALPDVIQKLNAAIEKMRSISGKVTPYSGEIIHHNQPTPAINTLKALKSECICYTDCGGYSICYCYGYCSDY